MTEKTVSWVVYLMTLHRRQGEAVAVNAVCELSEWEAMELDRPGYHRLVKAGIANEAEAELLARGNAGDSKASHATKFPRF
jgi:hypothetical protein